LLLRKPVPSPNVKGTLAPTIAAALVDAVPAFGQVKKPTLTHKTLAININAELDFCVLVSMGKLSHDFHSHFGKRCTRHETRR
jgi:hypothetical protein